MSLVGTRPILQDELLKYELHHRARIAIKPGITGMWQVSGRSDITDFEEVVRLDTEYISKETGAKVAVYRFPNLMGHSRPKYNSAVSTFCWAVANDESFTVNDRSTELELLYIDDLVEGMFDLLEGKEQHCEFDGVEAVADSAGCYCYVPVTH